MTYDRSVVFSIQHYVIRFVSDLRQVVVFSIQHCVIRFVSDLRQVGGFLYTTLCDKVCQ